MAILDAPIPFPDVGAWAVPLGLTIDAFSDLVPAHTEWFALVDIAYPRGRLSLYPASYGSIETTFPHQNANVPSKAHPWREGRLCLDVPERPLLGEARAGQPTSAQGRLAWHVESARAWLTAAATGDLVHDGDPYELPPFVSDVGSPEIVFAEDALSFALWSAEAGAKIRWGHADLRELTPQRYVAERLNVHPKMVSAPWGARVMAAPRRRAFWILLPKAPLVRAYQTPLTWGELRAAVRLMNQDLDGVLKRVAAEARQNGESTALLVGFPIPERVGGADVEMTWQSLHLPSFKPMPEMREKTRWKIERGGILGDAETITWLRSKNVAESHLRVRGELTESLRESHLAIIGVGALGSAVAELLVRMGLRDLVLMDWQDLQVENLRRHLLTLDDVDNANPMLLRNDSTERRYLRTCAAYRRISRTGRRSARSTTATSSSTVRQRTTLSCSWDA